MKKEIGKRVASLRHSMNMNKEQFAKMIGISGQYLGTVEAGVHGLSVETIKTLCEKTHVSADYILFGKEKISYEELNELFNGIDEEQIDEAFKALQNIALMIKSKKNKKII